MLQPPSFSLLLVAFAIIYLCVKQGEMIRTRGNRGYEEKQPHQRNKTWRLLLSGTAALSHSPHTGSREEATRSHLETNLSCPFQGVALKIHFPLCSEMGGSGRRTGRAGPAGAKCSGLGGHRSGLTRLLMASMARRSCCSTGNGKAALTQGSGRQPGSGASVSTPPALQQVPASDELVLGSRGRVVSLAGRHEAAAQQQTRRLTHAATPDQEQTHVCCLPFPTLVHATAG